MTSWQRHGRAFPPAAERSLPHWLGGFAALPHAQPAVGRRSRVFFSGRDAENRSHVAACSLDLDRLEVVNGSVTGEPLLSPGRPGTFDDSGCSVSCLVADGPYLRLYYTGWTRRGTVPFSLAVGLAVSDDGGASFHRHSEGPLLAQGPDEPFLCASPAILVESGVWRMWYVSGVGWEGGDGAWRPRYHIKYAESRDGVEWRRSGRVCIDFAHPREHALGRPHVLKDGGGYRMWYCWRGERYRLGYAESADGLDWRRLDDEVRLEPGAEDWEQQMQAYPMVFRDGDRLVMLYNGNGYGASGFGCATRQES
jgi:hypothetical protein